MNDRTLRPAKVTINKNPASSRPQPEEPESQKQKEEKEE